MPVVGSETGASRSFGEIPNIPEKYQAASRRGIHFFELRYPKPADMDQTVYGPFDLKASETWDTMRQRMVFNIRWLRENEAHIRFTPDSRGVAVAWMPDDKFWRNRIYLMDTRLLYVSIFNYHTKSGQYPGSMVRTEIDCMRDVLKEKKDIFKVFMDGKERDVFRTKEEAEEFINENTEVRQKVDKITGNVVTLTSKHKFKIVPGTTIDYRDEIIDLIRRENGRHEFGWTQCDEFQNDIKPSILKLIEERSRTETPADSKESILTQLRSMTPEEKEELKALLSIKNAVPESTHENVEEEFDNPDVVPVNFWEAHPVSHYRKMKKEELIKIYEGRGFTDGESLTFVKLVDTLVGQDSDGKTEPNFVPLKPEEVIT